MSQYTTQIRFICEQKAGYDSSVGNSEVNTVLENSWNKIFGDFPIYEESYRKTLCKKILLHYYLREISCETVGIWLLWLNTRMNEIMPYYNKLYRAAAIEFNPLWDTEYTRTGDRDNTENETNKGTSTDDRTSAQERDHTVTTDAHTTDSNNTTSKDLYSDTPQGDLTGVENENYLTNARKVTDTYTGDVIEDRTVNDTGNTTQTDKYQGSTTGERDATKNETFNEKIVGKMGGKSYSQMLMEYRNSLWNIDLMIIQELSDLFFTLY